LSETGESFMSGINTVTLANRPLLRVLAINVERNWRHDFWWGVYKPNEFMDSHSAKVKEQSLFLGLGIVELMNSLIKAILCSFRYKDL
jgi:hypothetical protein